MHLELAPLGVDVVTVCLDVEGREGAAPDLAAVGESVSHIAVVDRTHEIDSSLGVVNVPNGVWVDENLEIVRPAEFASPGRVEGAGTAQLPDELPDRLVAMAAAAGQIVADTEWYAPALRDWAANGADSQWVLSPSEVVERSGSRGEAEAEAAAHFELAQHLHRLGHGDDAVEHFRAAHRLAPGNWTFKRQAWELASRVGGPVSRFWQGPVPGREDEWPYDGDWLSDVEAVGPANYYAPHTGS